MEVTCFVHRRTTVLLITWLPVTALFAVLPANALNSTILNGTNNSVDRVALLAIKSLIRDDPQGVTSSWNESYHFCQWQGVTCSSRHQRVIFLDLSSRGLVGSLSPSIGNMFFLEGILLQNNSLSGEIPQQLGRLFGLQVLRVDNNSFEGNIPSSLSNCSNLRVLHLGINKLVGKIPYEFGSLTVLKFLVVHTNNLTASGIPSFVGNLSLLKTFSIGDCHLVGSIPDIFHRLQNLKMLVFADNELVGTIPPSIYNLSQLESLFLDNNHIHGTLDTNLVLLQPRIQIISVPNNKLTGPLHASIFNSTELAVLDVSGNRFSGKIVISSRDVCEFVEISVSSNSFGTGESDEMNFVDTLSNCSKLEILNVGSNNLRGLLPESLENFSTKLYFLKLSSNSLLGNLPSSLGNLSGLTELDLSYNQFMGTTPASFGRLQNLHRLKLRNNNLARDIPDTLGNLSLLIELHMGMNNLNGTIPSSLGLCKKLLELTLEQNFLRGRIPKNLFGITSLSISLNLGGNHLSGQLPFEIGEDLKNLNELILADNLLSGELPSSIGSCSSLQNLKIGHNFFHGSLPPSMVSLRALQNLDVSFNNFTGQIPNFLETLPLQSLNISFNNFEGQVSSKGVFSNASEIIIKGNCGLCGGIPELLLPKCSPQSKGTKKLRLSVILVVSVVPILFCAAAVSVYFFYRRKMKDRDADDTYNNIDEMPLIKVSYRMLYNATDGFSPNNVIGKGGFASVYRGNLHLYDGIVAVKVLNLHQKGGAKSFISECNALINARHRNLVKVITCCTGSDFEGNEFKALVYDFMPNGSLDIWLHSSHVAQNLQNDLPRLILPQRISIALDVAYALDYLHNHSGRTIVHCDLKPSNILLDKDMVAHVGDFGLSKILQPEYVNNYDNSTIGIRGTIGYVAPEYGLGGKVSTSGDIYSYGVLLLEMLTGKRPTDIIFGERTNIHNYAKTEMRDRLLDIVDPILLRNDSRNHMPSHNKNGEEMLSMRNEACLRLIELGVACSMELPQHRMDIDGVIQELHLVKEVMLGTSTS